MLNDRENRIRTCDPLVPNQVLYQAELFPDTNAPSRSRCSTTELLPHSEYLVLIGASLVAVDDAPSRSRTYNLLIRSQTLYPIALWVLI